MSNQIDPSSTMYSPTAEHLRMLCTLAVAQAIQGMHHTIAIGSLIEVAGAVAKASGAHIHAIAALLAAAGELQAHQVEHAAFQRATHAAPKDLM